MTQKIAILGGTFNPIHLGHLHLAAAFEDLFGFDQILLIPTKIPPHKQAPDLAPDADRYRMCQLAVKDVPYLKVCDIELKRKKKSYTYDTLLALKKQNPDAVFFLIMGSDMFLTFMQWYKAEKMLSMATLLTAAREPDETERLLACKKELQSRGGNACIADITPMVVCSTEVRRCIRSGEETSKYLSHEVSQYIQQNGLYR